MQIYGIRYGLRGFYSRGAKPLELNYHAVEGIHLRGGTILVGGRCQLRWDPTAAVYTQRCSRLQLFLDSSFQCMGR